MLVGIGDKGAQCVREARAPSPHPWPARPLEWAPGACSRAAAGALRPRLEIAPQSARPVSPSHWTGRRWRRPPALHRRPAIAALPGGRLKDLDSHLIAICRISSHD